MQQHEPDRSYPISTTPLRLPRAVREALIDHANTGYPLEVCGYLAGSDNTVTRHFALANLDESREHYTMDPKEQFAVVRDVRSAGEKLLAAYHSHPDTPARPSKEDIALAYDPSVSYLIISLANREQPVIRSFQIRDGEVVEEPIETID